MNDPSELGEIEKRIERIGNLWLGAIVISGIISLFLAIKLLNTTNLGFYALLIAFSLPIFTLIAGIVHVVKLVNRISIPDDDDDPDPEDKQKIPEIKNNDSKESNVVPLFSSQKGKKAA